jgi:hypothetical protein
MADLRIVDAPVLLQESITDDVKMPTGGLGNFSVRLGDILWYVITKEQLANKNYVDLSSKGVKDSLDEHIADKANPHNVTKAQVGLGNVDNTADVDKPVSNAVSSAIITATTDMATKAYVNQKDNLKADKATTLSGYGITDAYTKGETHSKTEVDDALSLKADLSYVDGKNGDLATLTTAEKTTLVRAINEVHDNAEGVVALYRKNVELASGLDGWIATLVKDASGKNQQQINDAQKNRNLERVSFTDFNIIPSNTPKQNSDNLDRLNNAYPDSAALDIFVPVGNYKFSRGLLITRPHQIRGVGAGEKCKSVFDFKDATPVGTATYKAGVFVAHSSTWDDTTYGIVNKPSGQIVTSGTGAVLENIAVINSSEHGIIKNAPCNFFGVAAMRNAKHGILTAANVNPSMTVYGGRINGIANQGVNVQCASLFNGKSGFAEFGDDANVINNDTCLAAYNKEFGFYGGNLLGSVHTSCQAHANTLGDYVMQGGAFDNSELPQTPASNLYNGCYAEGQRDSTYSINARSLVVNALGGKPQSDTENYLSPTIVGLVTKQISATTNAQHIYDGKGGAFTKVGLDGIKIGSDAVKTSSFDIQSNWQGRIFMGSGGGAGIVFFLKDFNTTLKTNRPWLPNGLSMGNTHSQTVGTAVPTTGTWDRGNIIWNEQPASGQPIGWVCISGGTSGTWKSFGTISD